MTVLFIAHNKEMLSTNQLYTFKYIYIIEGQCHVHVHLQLQRLHLLLHAYLIAPHHCKRQ